MDFLPRTREDAAYFNKDAVGPRADSKLVDELRLTALACAGSVPGRGLERDHREPPRRAVGRRDIRTGVNCEK